MKKKSFKLRRCINPAIKVGDIVRLYDGSGISCDKIDDYFAIVYAYPTITNSSKALKDLEFIVIKTGVDDSISECISGEMYYVQDIEVSINDTIFKTCSEFVCIIEQPELTIEEKIAKLLLIAALPFVEYYPHTRCDMYKILNPYTLYVQEKVVLSPVSEGFERALNLAITEITSRKQKFFS